MTKIREGYKETEIGVIPEDWEVSKLSQILQNRSEKYTPNEDEDFLYVALEHIDQESGRLIGIGKSSESTSTKSAFYKKDVLFGKLRPYLRKYWLSDIDGVCSTEILALKPLTHPEFAFYTIQSNKFIEDISNKAFGTKMPRTSWADMKDYKIPLPPLPEQKRIAEILSTTDAHIEKLDKIIEDYQLLKKGMMKKLLTEGIGHTEFKETEIGRIPKEWEVKHLYECFEFYGGYTASRAQLSDEGKLYLHYGDIHLRMRSYIDTDEDSIWMPRYEVKKEKNGASLDTGDIVFADASEDYNGVGKCVVIMKGKEDIVAGLHTLVGKEINGDFDLQFKRYFLCSNYVRNQFRKLTTGAKVYGISKGNIGQILVCIPSKEEQCLIGKILSRLEKHMEVLSNEKEELMLLKKALMEQLLTGNVRTI